MIWRPRTLTREQREERRLHAGRLLLAGKLTQSEIARHVGVSRMAVSKWAKELEQYDDDPNCLRNKSVPGHQSYLTEKQWQQVLKILGRGALKDGFETDRWTLRRICASIRRRFGVRYNANYLARKLHALGWSPQVPVPHARERDDELVEAWLRQDWPRIKKKAQRRGATIVFLMKRDGAFWPG